MFRTLAILTTGDENAYQALEIEVIVEVLNEQQSISDANTQRNAECVGIDTRRIDAILEAMKAQRIISQVQCEACRALINLCSSNDSNRVLIAQCGGIDAMLDAMKEHRTIADVQSDGCWALAILCLSNDANKQAIGEGGGIDAIFEAMPSVAGVQQRACKALRQLAFNDAHTVLITRKATGLVRIVQSTFPKLSEPNELLRLLIDTILEAMKGHRTIADVQRQACRALRKLCSSNDANRLLITESRPFWMR